MTEPRRRRRPATPQDTDPEESAEWLAHNRFLAGMALQPAPGFEEDREVLRRLQEAPVAAMAAVTYASNAVFLVELEEADEMAPDGQLRAIYKPSRGERPLWDFPSHTLCLREVATYWLSHGLGRRMVPATVLRDGVHGPGSWQRYVHPRRTPLTAPEAPALELAIQWLATFDVISNNADRKRQHVIVDGEASLWAIDNALSFLPYPRQRTFLIDLGGELIPAPILRELVALAGDADRRVALTTELAAVLDSEEVEATLLRLRELTESGTLPVLDAWDGRPFEWW